MKKLLLSLMILGILINWMPTSAEANAPTVAITKPPRSEFKDAFDVTITFSENVTGFTQSEVTLSPSTLATVTSFTGSDGTSSYTVQITPTAGQHGTLTISVAASVATATNGGEANTAGSLTARVDAKSPAVTITPPSGTQTGAFDVTFTFSESVLDFDSSDIELTARASVMSFTENSSDEYTAKIKPKVTGNITISVGANAARDSVGNGNTAATDVTVSVNLPHSIMVMEPDGDGPYNAAFDVMVMFTESVGLL